MQQKIQLNARVVEVNHDDIRMEGAQVSKGEVKGASSISESGFSPFYLWLAVFVVALIVLSLYLPGFLKRYGK